MPGLILVPTPLELDVIEHLLRPIATQCQMRIELCGFGPIAAAARSAALIERLKPGRVILLGLAGSFGDSHPIGSATTFDRVHCWGVGVGSGADFQTSSRLGFNHFVGDTSVGDCIELRSSTPGSGVLLTSCAASASEQEATHKQAAVPSATAEDMEGFGVALSCQLAGVPLTIVRGISNRVGDRNKSHWQIEAAMLAAANLTTDEMKKQS